jgi:hypothetical protein
MSKASVFEGLEGEAVFIKETAPLAMDGAHKAALNRKGNVFINAGDVESARRIFLTTGYSDGLSRVGDAYKKEGRMLDALRMYKLAHNSAKQEEIIAGAAMLIRNLIRQEEEINV